ncbi:MAG: acyl-CoA dehydratase activase [Desulfitobacteriaceae bacterium]
MYVAGIDIGSMTSKAVIFSEDSGVLSHSVILTGIGGSGVAQNVLDNALEKAQLSQDQIDYVVATGYGRISVPFKDKQVTEITCHARGVKYLFPEVSYIIDIGGQDSKVIRLGPNGEVQDFAMNDKCAAGTGRFLAVMAGVLNVGLNDLGPISLEAKETAVISSTCTVFAESEVISRIAEGTPVANIISGLNKAVAERVYALLKVKMIPQLKVKEGNIVLTGGVAKNAGVARALEEKIGVPLSIPTHPQLTGALGAALIAVDNVLSKKK